MDGRHRLYAVDLYSAKNDIFREKGLYLPVKRCSEVAPACFLRLRVTVP
jgi:hypothetical protein